MPSLDQCYADHKGDTVSFDNRPENAGQCLQWVEIVNRDVYNAPAFLTQGAIEWWTRFEGSPIEPYYDKITDGFIKKGDIVVFNTKVGSQFGHIDVAMADGAFGDFTGADSNWGGNKTVHLVRHLGIQYVLGALRPKGKGQDTMDEWDIKENFLTGVHREATAEDVKAWTGLKPALLNKNLRTGAEWLTEHHYITYFTAREASIAQLQKELASASNNVDRSQLELAYNTLGKVLGK